MINLLVEKKNEYTIQLVNILTPLIYEGIQSIYFESHNVSTPDNIFRNFQAFMKRIPKWNNEIISRETNRILNNSKTFSWLEDLIKATLKANIIVLTYNPSIKTQIKIDPAFYQNIKIDDFIHKIYIECARELWNNPYLFYHNYPPIELKRNQRDAINLIKDCIKEAIRKLLPVKHILHIFLGEEMEYEINDNKFENSISEVEERNLSKLIKKDLYLESKENNNFNKEDNNNFNKEDNNNFNKEDNNNFNKEDNNNFNKKSNNFNKESNNFNKESNNFNKESNNFNKEESNNFNKEDSNNFNKGSFLPQSRINSPLNNETEKTVGSKILNIINDKELNLTDNKTSSYLSIPSYNINTKIKNILDVDLAESETSVYHNPKINEKFHEIFSNSVIEEDNENNNIFANKDKAKFFSSYLNIN
jgi:hypothetical protein